MSKWLLLLSGILLTSPVLAEDAPPNEPPYVVEEEVLPDAPVVQEKRPERRVIQQTPKGTQYIQHPLSKKGLTLIDRDGSYHYATVRQSRKDRHSMLRLGAIDPGPGIESADGQANYQSMYGSGSPFTIFFDYEWKPLTVFGELGVQVGIGAFTAQGNGRFADGSGEAREKYTFYAIPISAGLVYRFQYFENQWIAPYVSGGGMYFALAEFRDDDAAPNFVGTPTAYAAAGLLFNLSAIDKKSAFTLDAEYNIHTLWMSLEARRIQASTQDLDFTGTYFSLGFGADY